MSGSLSSLRTKGFPLCSCEPGWTCPGCRDTRQDIHYFLDEPDLEDPAEVPVGEEIPEWVAR